MNRVDRRAEGTGPSFRRSTQGQATVEFAMLLPVLALVGLAVGQVALLAHQRVLLTHSAREGARMAAVGAPDDEVRAEVVAAGRLDPTRIDVAVRRTDDTVEVAVRYTSPTDVPLVGRLIDDVEMAAAATMRREEPP